MCDALPQRVAYAAQLLRLANGDEGGTIAVFAERSILIVGLRVVARQFLNQGVAQHTVAFAVNEHDAATLVFEFGAHGVVKHLELIVQDVLGRKAHHGVEQFVGMEVDDQRLVGCRTLACVVGGPTFGTAQRSSLVAVMKVWGVCMASRSSSASIKKSRAALSFLITS